MRDEQMHQRLLEWAQWRKCGDGSGYPTMSVLHEDWSPPSPGQTPTMKVATPSSARLTHRAMAGWSGRLRNTVALYYLTNLPIAQQAARLECAERTVHARIEQAHGLLRAALLGGVAGGILQHAESGVYSGNLGVLPLGDPKPRRREPSGALLCLIETDAHRRAQALPAARMLRARA